MYPKNKRKSCKILKELRVEVIGIAVYYGTLAAALRQFEEGGSIHNRIVVTVIEKHLNNKMCSNKTKNCDLKQKFCLQ